MRILFVILAGAVGLILFVALRASPEVAVAPKVEPKVMEAAGPNRERSASGPVPGDAGPASPPPRGDAGPGSVPERYDGAYLREVASGIRTDENGDLMLDDRALASLDAIMADPRLDLSPDALARIADEIAATLPGPAGERAGRIVTDYYTYLTAQARYLDAQPAGLDPATRFEGLVRLRESIMGDSVSDLLFYRSDDQSRYMIEALPIEQNGDLAPEEKAERLAALSARYHIANPPIPDWENRRDAFLARNGDERRLREAFTPRERSMIADYGIDLLGEERTTN